MPRARDGRLTRLAAESTRLDSTSGHENCVPRAWSTVLGAIRLGLAEAGIDAAHVAALRLHGAAVEPTQLDDRLLARRLEEELSVGDHDGLASIFAQKLQNIARRFEDGRDPDFGSASLAELLAWCLYRRGPCD